MTSTKLEQQAEQLARLIFQNEAMAIADLEKQINPNFFKACACIAECQGRVVLIGVGKSGHIGAKIAATMSSTGTPSFFLHPTEANHGDFGMLKPQDTAVLLSHSGETDEINYIVPLLHDLRIKTIAICGNLESTLAKHCNLCLHTGVQTEACPMGLAPTTSTIATLAIGDALALVVAQMKGFTAEDFARRHPGGNLGRSLLLKVKDIMHTGDAIPIVTEDTLLSDALYEMSNKRLGMTLILDTHSKVAGIFSDGDLRRALDKGINIHQSEIGTVMTRTFQSVVPETLAIIALELCEQHAITAMPVIDEHGTLLGAFNIHDLLNARVRL